MPYRRYRRRDPRRYWILARLHARVVCARLGRRGLVLTMLGAIWVLVGLSTLTTPARPEYTLLELFAVPRGAAWVVTGIVAMVYAWRPQGEDRRGFLALYVMAAYRCAAYLLGWVAWVVDGVSMPGGPGEQNGVFGALAWAAVVTLIVIISGWSESHRPVPRRGEDRP